MSASDFLGRLFGRRAAKAAAPTGDPERVAAVQAVLDELRPLLAADGGRARLVAVDEDGSVELALEGACRSCALVPLTLQGAITPRLREACPWITAVRAARR